MDNRFNLMSRMCDVSPNSYQCPTGDSNSRREVATPTRSLPLSRVSTRGTARDVHKQAGWKERCLHRRLHLQVRLRWFPKACRTPTEDTLLFQDINPHSWESMQISIHDLAHFLAKGLCADRAGDARKDQYEKLYFEYGWNNYYRDSNRLLNTPLTSATCFCEAVEWLGKQHNRHEQRSIVCRDRQVEG